MYAQIGRQFSFCLPAVLLLSTPPAVVGVERSVKHSALDLVQEALHREVFSMQEERDRLLALAEQEHPNLPEVKWHQGQVNLRGSWVGIDDVPGLLQGDSALAKYERIRATSRDTLQGHMSLASWCVENGLVDQQRAHLERVLDTVPDHAQARALLGHRFIQGDWRSPSEQEDLARTEEMRRAAMSRWGRGIEGIRKLLKENSPSKQRHAAQQLDAIYELDVIPVLEEVLAYDSSEAAMLVVDWLSNHSEQRAVAALMRQSVLSPWVDVRHRAASELSKREAVRYVPAMVAELATPVSMQFVLTPTRPRRMAYRALFTRETQDQQQELMLQREYIRRVRAGGDGRLTLMRAVFNAWNLGSVWQSAALRQNAQTEQLNRRIVSALNTATNQQLPADPQRWWTWWNEQQHVVRQGPKQTRRIQRGDQVTVADIVPQAAGGQVQGTGGGAPAECFAAGTAVWTQRGQMRIERVQVGDLVLSQDVVSGELGYKPVLRATIRDSAPLVRVEVDRESFCVTPGHLFWVSGDAWQQAAKLESALPLHTVDGVTTVLSVSSASAERTFNLEVADFHTYFVGKSRVMSHDVTAQRPVDVIVPGMRE